MLMEPLSLPPTAASMDAAMQDKSNGGMTGRMGQRTLQFR
jgi:hypothetical protein